MANDSASNTSHLELLGLSHKPRGQTGTNGTNPKSPPKPANGGALLGVAGPGVANDYRNTSVAGWDDSTGVSLRPSY